MLRDFFDPTPEQQNIVLIDAATLQKAQRVVAGCEPVAMMLRSHSTTFSIASQVAIRA